MIPIQWHLKNNWRVPETLEKVIPIPKSLHPHLQWWLKEDNVLTGQPLHPIKHALQIFTDATKEGWGAHLNKHTARGSWSLLQSKLRINYLELKAVFLALKEFQDLCYDKRVLVATDNTTVVSYMEGGMRSGPLCALLWRILTWCTRKQVLIAPGWPNMPWFWDLVTMSSKIPLSLPNLPNLLTQPFIQIPHRNLTNLNLHAWLLEPQQSRSRASLRQ